jgi:hypothetical protein
LYQVEALFNPQGISGTGLQSGDTYRGTGMTRSAMTWLGGFPDAYLFQGNFRIIGEKTGNNLLLHTTVRLTFAPDGSVSSTLEKVSFDCK